MPTLPRKKRIRIILAIITVSRLPFWYAKPVLKLVIDDGLGHPPTETIDLYDNPEAGEPALTTEQLKAIENFITYHGASEGIGTLTISPLCDPTGLTELFGADVVEVQFHSLEAGEYRDETHAESECSSEGIDSLNGLACLA